MPQPDLQVPLHHNGDFVGRGDFVWEDERVVGEVDGASKYGSLLRPGQTPQMAIMAEKRREARLQDAGYWVVRWGWADLWDGPGLAQRIQRAFTHAGRGLVS